MPNPFGRRTREDIIDAADRLREQQQQREDLFEQQQQRRELFERIDQPLEERLDYDRNLATRIADRGAEALQNISQRASEFEAPDIPEFMQDFGAERETRRYHGRPFERPEIPGRADTREELDDDALIDNVFERLQDPIHQIEVQINDFSDRIMEAASGFDISNLVPDEAPHTGREVITPARQEDLSWEERIEEGYQEDPEGLFEVAAPLIETLEDAGESIPSWFHRASSVGLSTFSGVPLEDVAAVNDREDILDYESVSADMVGNIVGSLGHLTMAKAGLGAAGSAIGGALPQAAEAFRSLPTIVQAGAEWGSYLLGRDIMQDAVWEEAQREEFEEMQAEYRNMQQMAALGLIDQSEIPTEEEMPAFREFAEQTIPDYVQTFASGFAAGAAGEVVSPVIREMAVRDYIPDSIYPLTQGFGTGAARGVAFTGVDKLFHPDDTTAKDLGLNVLMLGSLGALGTAGKWDEMRQTVDFIQRSYKDAGLSKYPENMTQLNIAKEEITNFKDQLWDIGRKLVYHENIVQQKTLDMYKENPAKFETDPYGDYPIKYEQMQQGKKFTDLTSEQRQFLIDQVTANYLGYRSALKHLEQLSIPMKFKDGIMKRIRDVFENSVSDSFTAIGMNNLTFDAITGDVKPAKDVTDRPALVQGAKVIEDMAKTDLTGGEKIQLQKLTGFGKSRNDNIIDYRASLGGVERVEEILALPGMDEADIDEFGEALASEHPEALPLPGEKAPEEPIALGPGDTIEIDDLPDSMDRAEIMTVFPDYDPGSMLPEDYADEVVFQLSDAEVWQIANTLEDVPERLLENYSRDTHERRQWLWGQLQQEVYPDYAEEAIDRLGIQVGQQIANLEGYPDNITVSGISEQWDGAIELQYADGDTAVIGIDEFEKQLQGTEVQTTMGTGELDEIEERAQLMGREPRATSAINQLEHKLANIQGRVEKRFQSHLEDAFEDGKFPLSLGENLKNELKQTAEDLSQEYKIYYDETGEELPTDTLAPDSKNAMYLRNAQKFINQLQRAHEEGVIDQLDMEDYQLPGIRETTDDIGRAFAEANVQIKEDIDTIIDETIHEQVREAAQSTIEKIETEQLSSKKYKLQYDFAKAELGEFEPEEIIERLGVIDSPVRNEYGSYEERKQMIEDMFRSAADGDEWVHFGTPGTRSFHAKLKNDPEVLTYVAKEFGAKMPESPLDEAAVDVEVVDPTIPEGELVDDGYYARIRGDWYPAMSAKPFAIEELSHLDLFRYKPSKEPGGFEDVQNYREWHIIEAESGVQLATGRTIDEAAQNLKELVNEYGVSKIEENIEKTAIESSPRYSDITEVTTPEITYEFADSSKSMYDEVEDPGAQAVLYQLSNSDGEGLGDLGDVDPEDIDPMGMFHDIMNVQPYERPVSRQEIDEIIKLDFDVGFDIGEIDVGRAGGAYKQFQEVIQMRDYGNMEILAHEIGHHLVKKLDLPIHAHADNLEQILEDFGLKQHYDEAIWPHEGAAEFFRFWFNKPSEAVRRAPRFAKRVQARLEANPEVHEAADKLQKALITWQSQGGTERTRQSIAKRETRDPEHVGLLDKIEYHLFADDAKVRSILKDLGYDWTEVEAAENPIKLYRLFQSVDDKVKSFLTEQQLSPKHQPAGPPLHDILKPVEDDIGLPTAWDEIRMKMPFMDDPDIEVGDFEAWALAKHALEREARWVANNVIEDEGMRDRIINAVEAGDEDFMASVIREHSPKVGEATGLRPDDIVETINELEKPEFIETGEKLDAYWDNLIDYAQDRGMFSEEQAENIKDAYNWYLPLHRVFGEGDDIFPSPSYNKFANLPEAVQRAYGSRRIIDDPIKNMIKNTQYIIRNADANHVGVKLIETLEEIEGAGQHAEQLTDRMDPHQVALNQLEGALEDAGLEPEKISELDLDQMATVFETRNYTTMKEDMEHVVMIRRDGEIQPWSLSPELHEFMEQINPQIAEGLNMFLKPLEMSASFFARGAVYSPGFWLVNNPLRDESREIIYRDNDLADKAKFFKSTLDGVKGLTGFTDEETQAIIDASGVTRASMISLLYDSDDPQKVKQLLGHNNVSKNPIKWLANAMKFTQETRYKGFFVEKLEDEDLSQMTPKEFYRKTLDAGYDARSDIMEDYGVKGKLPRAAERIIPFTSAGFTAVRHMYKKYQDPMTWLKTIAFITIPAIANWYRNRDDPTYQELDPMEKIYFWNVITEEGGRLAPAKPFAPGYFFGGLPEIMLDAMYHEDPDRVVEGLQQAFRLGMPNVQLPHVTAYIEAMANRRLDRRTDIVPMGEQHLEPQYQYSHYTSETAKYLGERLGMSPYIIDHLVRGQFSRLGQNVLDLGDYLAGAQDFQETIGAILGAYREPYMVPKSVDEIYQARDEAEAIVRNYQEALERGDEPAHTEAEAQAADNIRSDLASLTRDFSQINQAIDVVMRQDDLDNAVQDDVASYLNMMQVDMARRYLGKEGLDIERYFTEEELQRIDYILNNL